MKYTFTFLFFPLALLAQTVSLDSTFNANGRASSGLSSYPIYTVNVHKQSNGKIVATGYEGGSFRDIYSTRFNLNGSLDYSYGIFGSRNNDLGSNYEFLSTSCIQKDNKILVLAGLSGAGITSIIRLGRLDTTGFLDNTFGINGKFISNYSGESRPYDLAIQKNGKIVIAAGVIPSGSSTYNSSVFRLNSNGKLDSTFAQNAYLTRDLQLNGNDLASAIAIDSSQNILVGSNATSTGVILSRIKPNGNLDSTFGTNGNVQLSMINPSPFPSSNIALIGKIVVQPDGKYLLSIRNNSGSNFGITYDRSIIARYNTNGTLDQSFSGQGYINLDSVEVPIISLQSDGKIVAVAREFQYYISLPKGRKLFRLNANGSLDNTFGLNGYYKDPQFESASGICIQDDGKILLPDQYPLFTNQRMGVSRFKNTLISNVSQFQNDQTALSIYPNPSKDYLIINVNSKLLTIKDIFGKIMMKKTLIQKNEPINIKELSNGIYFISLDDSNVIRFVKE
jgi:uncharacterized delta-60 repeat protein